VAGIGAAWSLGSNCGLVYVRAPIIILCTCLKGGKCWESAHLPFSSRTVIGILGFERKLYPVMTEFSFAIFGFAETNDHSLVLRDCGSTMTMRSEALDYFVVITTASFITAPGLGTALVSGIISRVIRTSSMVALARNSSHRSSLTEWI